jgi:hypothetical protein
MSSRSIGSRAERLLALAVALLLVLVASPAVAGRRVVVLEFDGPKAERFRADVEAAVGKSHTIVSLDDWLDEASAQDAEKPSARNVRKLAKALEVDGVVVGEVEKRGARYYVNLRLRAGATGAYVAEVEVVVRQAKLGSDGARTLKEELLPAIAELERVGGDDARVGRDKRGRSGFGGRSRRDDDDEAEDDDDEPRSRRGRRGEPERRRGRDDDEDDRAADDDDRGRRGRRGKPARSGRDDDDRVAARDRDDEDDAGDDEDGAGDDEDDVKVELEEDGAGEAPGPRAPAMEASLGVSAVSRTLRFDGDLAQEYEGGLVGGAVLSATVYPLAFGARRRSPLRDLGVTLTLERVFKIDSTVAYSDGGMPLVASLPTTQQRLSAGLVYRHRLGRALALEAGVRFTKRTFEVDKAAAPPAAGVTIPSVDYGYVDPGLAARYQVSPKLSVGGGLRVGLALGAGELQDSASYGKTTVLPIDVSAGAAYQLTRAISVNLELALVTVGMTFREATMRTDLDQDGVIDVGGGRDTYVGGALSAGYAF